MELVAYSLSAKEVEILRRKFNTLSEITSFSSDLKFASQIACYGMLREIGTINDELARFIFDAQSGNEIRLSSLKGELVEWNNLFGLRVWSTDSNRLELRTAGFYDVIHPELSKNSDGTVHSLYIFPEIINQVAHHAGVELVLVKSWGNNSIFGGFDPAKAYYQTNFWEIENNDALKFSDLVRQSKIAFLGTHDLIAHIAGLDKNQWPQLVQTANLVFKSIHKYFNSVSKPSISSLILPYTVGVVLDDLAQPPSYGSKGHLAVMNNLIQRLAKNEIPANRPTILTEFPKSFQKIIDISRTKNIEGSPDLIEMAIGSMIQEISRSLILVK